MRNYQRVQKTCKDKKLGKLLICTYIIGHQDRRLQRDTEYDHNRPFRIVTYFVKYSL